VNEGTIIASLRLSSKAVSQEHLTSMAELNLATGGYLLVVVMGEHQFIRTQERSGSASVGCEGPQYQDRCAHAVISCRLLIEGAEIALNYGQRYGSLGENGSEKAHPAPIQVPCLPKISNLHFCNLLQSETLKSPNTSTSTSSEGKPNPPTSMPWTLSSPPPMPKSHILRPTSSRGLS
jgi:hypothetical protein